MKEKARVVEILGGRLACGCERFVHLGDGLQACDGDGESSTGAQCFHSDHLALRGETNRAV